MLGLEENSDKRLSTAILSESFKEFQFQDSEESERGSDPDAIGLISKPSKSWWLEKGKRKMILLAIPGKVA